MRAIELQKNIQLSASVERPYSTDTVPPRETSARDGVASSACHSEQSSLLKAALLPLPSKSLAAHFLLEPQDSLFYWLPTRLEREPKVKDLKTHSTNIESADYG
ncbi:MAG: hypothetical protein M0Q19_00890 [Candidatus Cloacimonetes bacterium]|nr:hypothetical protein [Candidatus Cloacimonadota bacterium]